MKKISRISRYFAVLMALVMVLTVLPTAAFAGVTDGFSVVVSMEGLTIGQGIYVEPSVYTLVEINDLVASEGYGPYTEDNLTAGIATLAMIIDKELEYTMTGSWDSDAYLSSVAGLDTGVVNIPDFITENDGPSNDENYGNSDEYLGEFDYSFMSGWMITVNDYMIPVGCAQYNVDDGAVVRWQFTLWGYGADLGVDTGWGMPAYFTAANKADLYTAYAYCTDDAAKSAVSSVMNNLTATQSDVDTAVNALKSAEKIADVKKKINAISGTVTTSDAAAIDAARKSYDALSDEEKAKLNIDTLTSAEDQLKAAKEAGINVCLNDAKDYLISLTQNNEAIVGSVGGEWWVLSMARAEASSKSGFYCRYLETVKEYVTQNINANEQLHRAKSTDNSRVILALVSIGVDPTDIAGHNLIKGLTSMKYVKKQGINGPIWALIALDSYNFEIPAATDTADQVTREALIEYTLSKQLENGGWALSGTSADPDMTAMAVQSLAPYYGINTTVKAAIDKAIACLSLLQKDNGGYASWGTVNSESCAQVVVALTALGIDPASDNRFIKNAYSVVDALCEFAVDEGGFRHTMDGTLNGMGTEQASYALVSYERFKNGKTSLYNMSDITELKADVHKWDTGIITKAPTCAEKGVMTYTCGCGDTKKEEISISTVHTWDNGTVTKQPTETETGMKVTTCTVCGKTSETELPKLTAQKGDEDNVKSPQTGDNSYMQIYLLLFAFSGAIYSFLLYRKKKEAQ